MKEGTKFKIKDQYDDPVGNWYICDVCEERIFMADKGYKFVYCPICGDEIVSFDGVAVCKDDCVIGAGFKKIIK